MAQTKARFTGPPAFPDSLHFSPRGEAKCVRGPSGLGASRTEEKGASRLARAGVLEQYVEHGKQAQRNHGGHIACFDRRVVGNAGYSNRKPRPTVFHESRITRHESRLFSPWCATGGATGNRRPDHCPRRQAAVFLFAIVQQKKLFCAIVLAPPGRCFPARCGAAWGGYGAAWVAAVPRAGNTACGVFTSHETRNMGFPYSSGDSKENSPKPGQQVFHESRITRHESRPLCFCRCFPARCRAAWRGYGAAWAAAVPRAGNTACKVFTSHETRNMGFPYSSCDSRENSPKPGQQVFHESRITRHESRPLRFSSHDFPRFPGISRYYSAPPPPGAGVRAPSAAAPAASGLLPLRWTRRGAQLPTPRQKRLSFVLVRVHSW